MPKIDLVYTSPAEERQWTYGRAYTYTGSLQHLAAVVAKAMAETEADWILLWDFSLSDIPVALIEQLAAQPVDIFHAGLKAGSAALPDVMNYVHPTWMYNVDGSAHVTHSNFRVTLAACMIRTTVFRKIGLFSDRYHTLLMSGVAFGYCALKSGAVVRYHAELLADKIVPRQIIPVEDEWIFARQFFNTKWQLWTLLNKPGFFSSISAWWKARDVAGINPKPIIHPSAITGEQVPSSTVSILAPTLDRYPYLEEELRELNEQTILPTEVLITDQTDKAQQRQIDISKYSHLNIRYFPQDEKGQCIAWNKLIGEAKGEYIFFFGDDAFDIPKNLLEKMLQTMQRFDADMVAACVREKGITYAPVNPHYYMSDTFPITLIKKSVVAGAGNMDMFFNKRVKADHDLAMRCHLNGALMIYDPSAEIGHHRAPSGGLRTHNARTITGYMTKNMITKVLNPTVSEIFIFNKYYTEKQYRNHVKIKYMNQVIINGNIIKKILRLVVLMFKIPYMVQGYYANYRVAMAELEKRRTNSA